MTETQVFAAVQTHCNAKEDAVEEHPWGHTAWKIGAKVFAIGDENGRSVTVKATLDDQAALIQLPGVAKASYVGRYGWVTVTINDEESLDLALRLIDESYEVVRPKRRKSKRESPCSRGRVRRMNSADPSSATRRCFPKRASLLRCGFLWVR